MSKLAEISALENGKGIQYLLDAAYAIFRNPIAMFDTNYMLKAYTDVSTDDPVWNELIASGTFSIQTQEFFAKEGFIEEVANADKLVILRSGKLQYDRISGNIFNKNNIKVANVVMVGSNAPIDEDAAAFEGLINLINKEIHDDEYYTAFGKAYHEANIIKLLDGIIKNPAIYTDYVQILYEGFEDYLYVAAVDIRHSNLRAEDSHHNRLLYIKNMLENIYQSFKFAIYADYIVMVMSSKYKVYYDGLLFDKENNPFKQNNLYAGISASFENPYELRGYYDQAVGALAKGIEKNNEQRVFSA